MLRVLVASVLSIACDAPDPQLADAKPEPAVQKRGPEPPKPVDPEPPKPTTAVDPPPPEPPPVVAVDLTGYSLACKKHADCELVKSNRCSMCGCAHEPIAKSEYPRFLEAANAIVCPPPAPLTGGAGCGSCTQSRPRCRKGTCVAEF